MRRVAVVGPSGSGKSTLGRALAELLGVPFLEQDSIFHQPGWKELELAEFRRRVQAFVAADGWVVDGNYSRTQDLVLARADTVVWLRMSKVLVMRQVIGRTLHRLVTRTELWNGNRESLRNVLSLDADRSIVVWAWRMHEKYDERYEQHVLRAPGAQQWVQLRSRREVREFLEHCAGSEKRRSARRA
jgi:adenylate kinase family enzyme